MRMNEPAGSPPNPFLGGELVSVGREWVECFSMPLKHCTLEKHACMHIGLSERTAAAEVFNGRASKGFAALSMHTHCAL